MARSFYLGHGEESPLRYRPGSPMICLGRGCRTEGGATTPTEYGGVGWQAGRSIIMVPIAGDGLRTRERRPAGRTCEPRQGRLGIEATGGWSW